MRQLAEINVREKFDQATFDIDYIPDRVIQFCSGFDSIDQITVKYMLERLDWYLSQADTITEELLLMQIKGYESCSQFLIKDNEIVKGIKKTLKLAQSSDLNLSNSNY